MKQIVLLLFFSNFLQAQNNNFKIFLFENRYSDSDKKSIQKHNIYKYYNLFSQGYLESTTRKGHIDLEKVKLSLEKKYPDKDSKGILVLDFEAKVYNNLRDYAPTHKHFLSAEKEFIDMIELVKKERPNLLVGVYGLPFKFYYQNQRKYNSDNKFDKILCAADFIAPSLYVLYSENEHKEKNNIQFLEENLKVSLQIGTRIGKPVIPFFWYMVNPVNKTYGHEIISKNTLRKYYTLVKNYTYNNSTVKGIFWWDVSEKYFTEYMQKAKEGKRNPHTIQSKIDVFNYYHLEK